MLEAMYQASSWLVLHTEGFENTWAMLKEAKNVKYQGFVAPGDQLVITAKINKQEGNITKLKTSGTVNGAAAVSGILVLESKNFAAEDARRTTEWLTRKELRELFDRLYEPAGVGNTASSA